MKHNIKKRIAAILCSLAVAVPMAANISQYQIQVMLLLSVTTDICIHGIKVCS